jgi:hypothetical protein
LKAVAGGDPDQEAWPTPYGAPLRRRRSRRRSRSDSPPQMPNFSLLSRAYCRHSWRTTQPRQTSLASRVEPPRSGKKRSGSTPKQFADRCHVGTSLSQRSPVASAGRRRRRTRSVTGWLHSLVVGCDDGLPEVPKSGSIDVTTIDVTTSVSSSSICANTARGNVGEGCRALREPVNSPGADALWGGPDVVPRALTPKRTMRARGHHVRPFHPGLFGSRWAVVATQASLLRPLFSASHGPASLILR